MDSHSAEKTTRSRSSELRDGKLNEWLFDILTGNQFDRVKDLPYGSRLRLKRWYQSEADRLAPVMMCVAGMLHATPSVEELLDLAASETVDLQGIGNWMRDHRDELTPLLLVEIVSAAMGRGVINMTSKNGSKPRRHTTTTLEKVGKRWLQLEAAGKNKTQAAEIICKEVGRGFNTVYNYLTDKLESNKRAYPNGIDAARQELYESGELRLILDRRHVGP